MAEQQEPPTTGPMSNRLTIATHIYTSMRNRAAGPVSMPESGLRELAAQALREAEILIETEATRTPVTLQSDEVRR